MAADCRRCGACCRNWIVEADSERAVCLIYEARPTECRGFRPGTVRCRQARREQGMKP